MNSWCQSLLQYLLVAVTITCSFAFNRISKLDLAINWNQERLLSLFLGASTLFRFVKLKDKQTSRLRRRGRYVVTLTVGSSWLKFAAAGVCSHHGSLCRCLFDARFFWNYFLNIIAELCVPVSNELFCLDSGFRGAVVLWIGLRLSLFLEGVTMLALCKECAASVILYRLGLIFKLIHIDWLSQLLFCSLYKTPNHTGYVLAINAWSTPKQRSVVGRCTNLAFSN